MSFIIYDYALQQYERAEETLSLTPLTVLQAVRDPQSGGNEGQTFYPSPGRPPDQHGAKQEENRLPAHPSGNADNEEIIIIIIIIIHFGASRVLVGCGVV